MSRNDPIYSVGQHVTGKVEKLLRYGIFVYLDDGTRAYIRRRELTWAGTIDPRELWREGDKIEGVVMKPADTGHSLELSHRATLPDPWQEFVKKFQQGDVIEGVVKSVMAYGVFVEILPGVDGLIPKQELATWDLQKLEDEIWVDDEIEAVITHLDRSTRKLRLSIRTRLKQLELITGVMERLKLVSYGSPIDKLDESKTTYIEDDNQIEPFLSERVGRILVVDDYDDVRLPLLDWLHRQGYAADGAKNAEQAIEKISSESYGMLIIDLNLPGMDGLAFLRQIRQSGINCHAVIMSTLEWLARRSCEIEKTGVVEVFIKPLDLDEIQQVLTRIGRGEKLPPWQMTTVSPQLETPKPFQNLAATANTNRSLAGQFRFGLKQLVIASGAEQGLIFKLDPVSQTVSITMDIGEIELNREATHVLKASPVREVINDGERILENTVSERAAERFRKLLDLLPFESCIGVPIEAAGETHRALFLFHRQREAFNQQHLQDTLATGSLFSMAIEREKMEHRFRAMDKILLSGQLAGGFSHEVYNKMSGLEIQLRNLQIDCETFDRDRPTQPVSFADIQQAVHRLKKTFDDLKDTVELFQQLMRPTEEKRVSINEVIEKAIALLRPTMQDQQAKVEMELDHDLPPLTVDVVQLQQVFLNIMLNAVQQMALKPGRGKLLTVTTSYQNQKGLLVIRFSDTGPGIHRQLWDKIFDLGFTTRLGGTGQGLYIASCLVEALGGKIFVDRSPILIGTTFVVELPLNTIGEGR